MAYLCDVYELDKSFEGIYWIKLVSKQNEKLQIHVCACYLTPETSCRENVAQEVCQDYMYSDDRHTVILGDFNARLGAINDYNEILNKLPPRIFLDTDQN